MILSHITKRYRGTTALDDLSLAIEEGQITAVLGESGAGKTTLLNCIMGLIPFEGEIDGQCFPKAKRREGCSYLFQDALLLPNLTAEENIRFVLPKEAGEQAREMLARVGLRGKEGSYPHELSGGEKQRVSIARAFCIPAQTSPDGRAILFPRSRPQAHAHGARPNAPRRGRRHRALCHARRPGSGFPRPESTRSPPWEAHRANLPSTRPTRAICSLRRPRRRELGPHPFRGG